MHEINLAVKTHFPPANPGNYAPILPDTTEVGTSSPAGPEHPLLVGRLFFSFLDDCCTH